MIIRIMGEGQYRVDSCVLDDLNVIDNKIVEHVGRGDQEGFRRDLEELISAVKKSGSPIDAGEIAESDVIVPPGDMTFEEAKRVFSGQGLIGD